MVNFGLLAAEIVLLVWGTPANFNGFCVLALLLQRRRSMDANQTLHSVWPLPGLVDYIYIFGGCFSVTEFCQVQNSLRPPSLALSYWQRYCTAVEQRARVWQTSNLRRLRLGEEKNERKKKKPQGKNIMICPIP